MYEKDQSKCHVMYLENFLIENVQSDVAVQD